MATFKVMYITNNVVIIKHNSLFKVNKFKNQRGEYCENKYSSGFQEDVNDIESLITNWQKDEPRDILKNQARAIVINIREHIEELIKE